MPSAQSAHPFHPFPKSVDRSSVPHPLLPPLPSMTALEFAPASAGAGVVSLGGGEGVFELLFVLLLHPCHDVGGGAALAELVGHEAHGAVDVVEEGFVAGAEVV